MEDILEKLLDIVEEATESWSFWPPEEFGASDALIPSEIMIRMGELLTRYTEAEGMKKIGMEENYADQSQNQHDQDRPKGAGHRG